MPVSINGVDQMPPEEKKILLELKKESNKNYWLAVSGLIVAILSIVFSIVLLVVK